jgi:alcohol dehydrogenase class IV
MLHSLFKALLDHPESSRKRVLTIMIPTTAGTGAEVTPNAIVAVPERQLKIGVVSPAMVPDHVVLDPFMVKTLPRALAAATGIDALAHCLECYTGNKANTLSDLYAAEGLDLILNNILPACGKDSIEAKNRMQLAACYGGLAITASGTTAVHALSYPLGGRYHIPHGVSNAMLLVPVMRFNAPACQDRLAAAYDRCVHTPEGRKTDAEKSEYLLAWLERLVKELDIPVSLAPWGVTEQDVDSLARSAMEVGRLLSNNRREVTIDDAKTLYREIL